ncbi:MAG: PAS domain S-box protein [Vicinamibacterales bacterium]
MSALPRRTPPDERRSRAREDVPIYSHLAGVSGEMVYRWRVHPEPFMEYISPAVEGIVGRRPEEFYADPSLALRLTLEEDQPRIRSLIDDPSERADPVFVRLRHMNGSIVWIELVRMPIRDDSGRIVAVEGVMRDVSRQKALEAQRDAQVALLDALIANIQDGVMAESADGIVTVANAAFCRMFGLGNPSEIIGLEAEAVREILWAAFVPDADAYRSLTRELRERGEPQLGFEIVLTDGRVLDRDYVPVPGPERTTVHMWHYRDVTQRRNLEFRLRESSRSLRELSARAEQTREDERRLLARVLHDELGQLFTSIRLELRAAVDHFRESARRSDRPLVDRLQAAVGLTDIGVASLRSMTTALRPPILDHLGLVPAIRWEASVFSKRTGMRCYVRSRPASFELDDARVTALYRILLAAMDNIAKHADAGTVWIHLARQRGLTLMDVRDNGRGITAEQAQNPLAMGLLAMRERALALGGEVRVTSARRQGTRVRVVLPDDQPVQEASAAARKVRKRA